MHLWFLQLDLLKESTAMHGVLGQTVNKAKGVWPDDDLAFHGEGLAEDYRISSLVATDFKFNMFGQDGSAPAVLTRARMLLANAVSKPAAATYQGLPAFPLDPRPSKIDWLGTIICVCTSTVNVLYAWHWCLLFKLTSPE